MLNCTGSALFDYAALSAIYDIVKEGHGLLCKRLPFAF
jgi:hypothetical protein